MEIIPFPNRWSTLLLQTGDEISASRDCWSSRAEFQSALPVLECEHCTCDATPLPVEFNPRFLIKS